MDVVVLRNTDGGASLLKTPVLIDPCLTTPVLKTPVPVPVPVPPVRKISVLKVEPEAKTDGAAKLFVVEFV